MPLIKPKIDFLCFLLETFQQQANNTNNNTIIYFNSTKFVCKRHPLVTLYSVVL